MNALNPNYNRSYEDENVNDAIHESLRIVEHGALKALKENPELMDLFISELKRNHTTVADAWGAVLFKLAEEYYVASVEKERELRKKLNIKDPEDEKPINLDYVFFSYGIEGDE